MPANVIPRILQPLQLAALLPHVNLRIIDLSRHATHLQSRLPGAVHLDYARLIYGQPPAPGLLPPKPQLQRAFHSICLTADTHVVAYDDQANSRASRLLWTLQAVGHANASLLDGGLSAWQSQGHAVRSGPADAPDQTCAELPIEWNHAVIASRDYVLNALDNVQIKILDARTPQEYHGLKSPSLRNGRIPGAVNLNWLDTINPDAHFGYRPAAELNAMVEKLGITREHEIITYCQTHQRSSHIFVMLRHLGFDKVRGYPGSWSEWGNDAELPIE